MIHQDDLQFWLLEHKESKSHLLQSLAIANKIARNASAVNYALSAPHMESMSPQEMLETLLKISTDAFILAEKIKI